MTPVKFRAIPLYVLLAGSVAPWVLSLPAWAQGDSCSANGLGLSSACLPQGKSGLAAGTVVVRSVQPNVLQESPPDLGNIGFSISIDGVSAEPDAPRRTIAGAPARPDPDRGIDRLLAIAGVELSYDGLGAKPRLSVSTESQRRSYVAGERVSFHSAANYPAWIARAEVVVSDSQNRTVALVPLAPNGTADWAMPANGDDSYSYYLRVFDAQGRRDETASRPLTRVTGAQAVDPQSTFTPVNQEDMTVRRGIPVRGGAITVSGRSAAGQPVTVLGERVAVDPSGRFMVQRILPPGSHAVAISVDGRRMDRSVLIARSEWFATGIIDLSAGRSDGKSWRMGRIAGFADGVLANGTRITASVDTQERELRDLFRDFGRKNPDRTLREMRSQDVFATFGDDSEITELAPTSGQIFLRAERDGSHIQWGDFKPRESLGLTVRSDRALYGLSGEYRSPNVTSQGESRFRISGYAAQPDSLVQRDILRGTGGSAYFLSRQDILTGSETVIVQTVSRSSGLVLEARHLAEGRDYRINRVQGVIILNSPLASSVDGDGLISDNPLGDHDVNLVVQYEYVPTTGTISGYSTGGRGEVWVNDNLRIGLSAQQETTGLADTTLAGADILWRDGESREVLLEYAASEGPGFGSSFSYNGGLDQEPRNPSYGQPGVRAHSWRIAGKTDLAFAGLSGNLSAFYDRKDGGFSSPDQEFEFDQAAWGLAGTLALRRGTDLTFGVSSFKRDDGKRDERARIGFVHQINARWQIEGELSQDRREGPSLTSDFGERTDAALRLTWTPNPDLSGWVFGQSTLSHDPTRLSNDRVGFGASMRLSDKTDLSFEVSDGNLGKAGSLEFAYRRDADTTSTIGYRLDPMRRHTATNFSGRDKGSLVFSSNSRINDRWSYSTEQSYSAMGNRPSSTAGYGITYTPSAPWTYEGMVQYGESRESDGTKLQRRGLSFGMRYKDADLLSAGLRAEWRREKSDRPANQLDRDTFLISGYYDSRVSEDWRMISSIDAVISDSDQSSYRDGHYVEARFGYAWQPVANDNLNALVSYSYLYDLPGADQVNIDGDVNGDRQKSHLLNASLSWQVNPTWTLGAKYGYRLRETAERANPNFTSSEAHLGVLRADYHVVHNWDVSGEVRMLYTPRSGMVEKGALLGVYRLFGDRLRVGGGYLWGEIDDDLRKIKSPKSGFFINITTQF